MNIVHVGAFCFRRWWHFFQRVCIRDHRCSLHVVAKFYRPTRHCGNRYVLTVDAGHRELIDTLAKDERLSQSKAAVNGLEDVKLLFKYCDLMGILDKVSLLTYWYQNKASFQITFCSELNYGIS